ncbi:hypothetical protein DSECCO2_657960 [anaerobic digester metagenome]
MAPRSLCRPDHFLTSGIAFADADVVVDRVPEQIDFLEDHADAGVQFGDGDIADICSADGDGPGIDIPKTGDEARDGRFAAARGADQGGHAFLGNMKAHVRKHRRRAVAEADMVEDDIHGRGQGRLRRLGQGWRVEHFGDAVRGNMHVAHLGNEDAEIDQWFEELVADDQEKDEHRHRKPPRGEQPGPEDQQTDKAQLEEIT